MNTTTILIGTAVFLFGLYTIIFRAMQPHKLAKLAALKDLFGEQTGDRIHLLCYAVIPLAAGVIFLFAGFKGAALF